MCLPIDLSSSSKSLSKLLFLINSFYHSCFLCYKILRTLRITETQLSTHKPTCMQISQHNCIVLGMFVSNTQTSETNVLKDNAIMYSLCTGKAHKTLQCQPFLPLQSDFLSSQTPNLHFNNNQNQPQNSVESMFLIPLLYIECFLYYSSLS